MTRVKGSKISSKMAFVRAEYGDDAAANVLRALTPEEQSMMSALFDGHWYPLELYQRVLELIAAVVARGDHSIFDRIGRYTAERQLSGVYKAFSSKDLIKMMKNQGPMHSRLNDPAEMTVESPAEGRCIIHVRQPQSSVEACAISAAFYRRSAELAGAKGVSVREPQSTARGGRECRFEIGWTT